MTRLDLSRRALYSLGIDTASSQLAECLDTGYKISDTREWLITRAIDRCQCLRSHHVPNSHDKI